MTMRLFFSSISIFAVLSSIGLSSAFAVEPSATSSRKNTGTTLKIFNNTNSPVPVQITLGKSSNPANNYGISSIAQLPAAWRIVPEKSAPTTQGIFILAGKQAVSFNSGSLSFSGNVAFGPKFSGRGCGSSVPGACYPNSINLGEFTLNIKGGAETVDISDVNGANAYITINFSGQTKSNLWNSGAFPGANPNVKTIANQLLSQPVNQPGVYGWQATNCVSVVPPLPNPTSTCPAPIDGPGAAQLQSQPQCNIQRGTNVPTGGTVAIVFGGYLPNSAPGVSCVTTNTIMPASGNQSGGTKITIAGWGLAAVTGVTLQGAAATNVVATNGKLSFTTPPCNFCTSSQPWYSNVVLNLSNGTTYTLPADTAGPNAIAAFTYTDK